MSDYAAAQHIVSAVGGNIIIDSDMEFNPTSESGYTDLQLWYSNTSGFVRKDNTYAFNGTQSIELDAKHESNKVGSNSQHHVDTYQTDLTGIKTYYPVVPGMKITVKFQARINWTNHGGQHLTIQDKLFSAGIQLFNADKTSWGWMKIASTGQGNNWNNQWKEYIGTFTIPTNLSYSGGAQGSGEPAYITPWLQGDTLSLIHI